VFSPTQTQATVGVVIPSRSPDYPYNLTIGPSYFESYRTWPDTKFIHGFNLGKNSTANRAALLQSVSHACKALNGSNLLYWHLGNEPDLYKTSAQGIVRPSNWTEKAYVEEWLALKRAIKAELAKACPGSEEVPWIAPSFAGTNNSLKPVKPWELGINVDKDIDMISSHKFVQPKPTILIRLITNSFLTSYIGGATQPGVTLQDTLMNHNKTVSSISNQVAVLKALEDRGLPFILGETNSLYNQGRPGLSNTFGAALWGLDFNLWCASQGIARVHMHMGTNYRYASWMPIDTNLTTKGTKAPYYGNIAVASAIGDQSSGYTQVKNFPLPDPHAAAYATFLNWRVNRVVVINMNSYNYTDGKNPTARPVSKYTFALPELCGRTATVQRLMANGSDAITGITYNGYSYNYELDGGKPVLLTNVTTNEKLNVNAAGEFTLQVPYSSAAVVQLDCFY